MAVKVAINGFGRIGRLAFRRKIDSRVISLAGAWLNRTIPAIGREMLR